MNKNLHRIVFNQARGLLMATAESACSHSRSTARSRRPAAQRPNSPAPSFRLAPGALALFMTLSSTLGAIQPAQAQLVADPTAPGNQQPTITAAANSVPLINIQTPSAGGVSRNTYSRFDVQQNGVILNNAQTNASTQLGGWIQGNPNLAGGTARIILNEVNSNSPSLLRGYVEIGGDRAQVIIANPAGVTCDGCGFINANRATLTTGTPTFTNGALDGFRVQGGQIVIQGNGLDATQADYTDLIARSVQINAGLWANTLKVVAGSNQVSIDAGSVTPIAGSGAAPALAIDVAQLGGMYAGKITLVGSEAGVGVRNAGQIGASAGEVAITVDGQLVNRGLITAQGAVTVNATGLDNQGAQVQATGDLTVALGAGTLDNTGGLLRANQTLNLSAASLTNRNTQGADQGLEGHAVSLTADQIANADGAIRADLGLDIVSGGTLDNTRGLIAGQTVQLLDPNRAVAASKTLAITNTAGTLFADQNLSIDAARLTGDGNLYSLGDLGLWLNSDFSNAGQIIADRNATLFTAGRLSNSGDLWAGNNLTLTATDLDNTATGEIAAFITRISLTQTLTNRGLIDGIGTAIDAGTVENLGSGRLYGDYLGIAATTLHNTTENAIAPTIAARQRLDLGLTTLTNDSLIFSGGDLAIGGVLDSNRQASGRAGTITNAGGTIQALGALAIAATDIVNTNPDFSATVVAAGSPVSRTIYYTSLGSFTEDQIAAKYDAGIWGPLLSNYGNPNPSANSTISFDLNATVANPNGGNGGSTGQLTVYNYLTESYQPFAVRIDSSAPGQLLSGGAMTLDASNTLTNDKSRIIAGGTLDILGQSITNIAAQVSATEYHSGTNYSWRYAGHDGRSTGHHCDCDFYAFVGGGYAANVAVTLDASITTAVDHQSPGGGASVPTRTTASTPGALATPVIPNTSLYSVLPAANSHVLVETDPRFADYRTWLSSDYLLGQLGLDPTVAQKRLGDGFYEQQLIREQIAQLTGQRFLVGYASDELEYRALMDSGISQARAWNLIPGVALTAAQIAQLTSDLVWLVEQTVTLPDGSTQQVLVPQVYLLPRPGDLDGSGTLIAGQTVSIHADGGLTNSGTVAGRTLLDLSAANIHNLGGRLTGQAVNLRATNDILNIGGRIEARDSLTLAADRDIVVETTVASGTGQTSNGNFSRTQIDRVAGLYVTGGTGSLTAAAGRDLTLTAAEVVNAGSGATTLAAVNNLTLGTVTTRDQIAIESDDRNHVRIDASREVGTRLRTQGNASLIAGNDLLGRAVDLQAQGDLTLAAERDVILSAGRNEQSVDIASYSRDKSGGGLTRHTITRNFQTQAETSTAQTGRLAGQNVNVQAGQDIVLEGGQITAQDTLALAAERNLTIAAGESSASQHQTRQVSTKETLGLGTTRLTTTRDETTVTPDVAQLSAKTITLQSGQDMTLVAPRIEAETLRGTAGGQLTVAAATATHELKESSEFKTNRFNFNEVTAPLQGSNGIQNSLGLVTMDSFVTGGRIKDKVKLTESGSEHVAVVAEIDSKTIALTSGSDTTLVAPLIQAESLSITAGEVDGQVVNPEARIQLLGVKESTSTSGGKNSHSFVHETVRDGGTSQETLLLPDIHLPAETSATGAATQVALVAPGGLVVGATTLTPTQLEQALAASGSGGGNTPSSTPFDLKTQALTLAQQPGLAWLGELTKRDDVDWQKIELVKESWDYKRAGLTPEGAAIVVIVVTILTWGAASSAGAAVGGSVGSATGSTMAASVAAAATTAAITTLASQAAVSLINNQGDVGATLEDLGSKESIKQLVAAMLTAGVTAGVTSAFNLPNPTVNTAFADRFTTYATQAAVRAGVQSVIYGQPLDETLKIGLVAALAQSLTAEVGDWATENNIAPGDAAKILAHAVVQCASASLNSQDCGSAALGGAVAEALSPLATAAGPWGSAVASMGAMLAASLTGQDALTALAAANTVDVFNRQLHIDTYNRLRDGCRGSSSTECQTINRIAGVSSGMPSDDPAIPASKVVANYDANGNVVSYVLIDRTTNQPTMIMEPLEFAAYRNSSAGTQAMMQLSPQYALDFASSELYASTGNSGRAWEHFVAGVTSGDYVRDAILGITGAAASAATVARPALVTSEGTANAATVLGLRSQLASENLANIAAQDVRLAAAVNGSGKINPNFSIGTGTTAEANQLGQIWVGDGARLVGNQAACPGCLISADGTRIYRPPQPKASSFATTGVQANFVQQTPTGAVISNGHLNVTP